MMLTRAKSGGSSFWWVIGILMLPFGAILWAWSQPPDEDEVSRLVARPFVADVLEENKELSGNQAGDLSAMSREEIEAAYDAMLCRVESAAEERVAQFRWGMVTAVAAFCCWVLAIICLLEASRRPLGMVEDLRQGFAVQPARDRSTGLAATV